MTRRTLHVPILVIALVGGYLAATPSAPRSASQPGANGLASASPVWGLPGPAGTRSGAPSLNSGVPPSPSSSRSPDAAGSTRAPATASVKAPTPTRSSSPAKRPRLTAGPTRSGLASTYGSGWSEWWVALPDGPGWRFRVCGPGGCRELVSHDAGPDRQMQREGRIVDLPVGAFEDVCGVSDWRVGLCPVTVTILGRA